MRRPLPSGHCCDVRAKCLEHALGVIAGRHGLNDRGDARSVEAGEQDGRFHLGRRHRQLILNGLRVAGAFQRERQAAWGPRPQNRCRTFARGDSMHPAPLADFAERLSSPINFDFHGLMSRRRPPSSAVAAVPELPKSSGSYRGWNKTANTNAPAQPSAPSPSALAHEAPSAAIDSLRGCHAHPPPSSRPVMVGFTGGTGHRQHERPMRNGFIPRHTAHDRSVFQCRSPHSDFVIYEIRRAKRVNLIKCCNIGHEIFDRHQPLQTRIYVTGTAPVLAYLSGNVVISATFGKHVKSACSFFQKAVKTGFDMGRRTIAVMEFPS